MRPQAEPHARLITYVTDRPGHDARYAIDATKLVILIVALPIQIVAPHPSATTF
jgi:dTDP-D-glucose 4,6-dehydratase